MTAVTTLRPRHWRALNHLHSTRSDPLAPHAQELMSEQSVSLDDLVALERAGYLDAAIADTPLELTNVKDQKLLGQVELHLTKAGSKVVTGTPSNRVVVALVWVARRAAVRYVRARAAVRDDTLKQMEAAGLITADFAAGSQPVHLEQLRRIPDQVFLTLTRKGRSYYPVPSSRWGGDAERASILAGEG